MIRISVFLISAISRDRDTELARMDICNLATGSKRRGDYEAVTYRGRSTKALNAGIPSKRATVANWPREELHIWNLVRWFLDHMGYVQDRPGVKPGGPMTVAEPELAGWRYPDGGRWAFVTYQPDVLGAEPVYVFRAVPTYQ